MTMGQVEGKPVDSTFGETGKISGLGKGAWVLRRKQQRALWEMPKAKTNGFMIGQCVGVSGTNFAGNIIFLPFGQKSPVHTSNGEHLIFQLEGEVEFRHEDETFTLEKYDMLFIPPDYSYEYANVGMGNAAFFGVAGKVDEWPTTNTYEDV
jgi:quercetin dioxygenase-like cupin family protein